MNAFPIVWNYILKSFLTNYTCSTVPLSAFTQSENLQKSIRVCENNKTAKLRELLPYFFYFKAIFYFRLKLWMWSLRLIGKSLALCQSFIPYQNSKLSSVSFYLWLWLQACKLQWRFDIASGVCYHSLFRLYLIAYVA